MPNVTMTWANRKHDPATPELVCAWDEYCLEDNLDGWEADKAKALASWGDDLLNHVDIEVYIDYEVINGALNPKPIQVDGEVRSVT